MRERATFVPGSSVETSGAIVVVTLPPAGPVGFTPFSPHWYSRLSFVKSTWTTKTKQHRPAWNDVFHLLIVRRAMTQTDWPPNTSQLSVSNSVRCVHKKVWRWPSTSLYVHARPVEASLPLSGQGCCRCILRQTRLPAPCLVTARPIYERARSFIDPTRCT